MRPILQAAVCWFISDRTWFWIIQAVLVGICALAFLKMTLLRERSVVSSVTRGPESRELMWETVPFVLTAIVSIVFAISTYPHDGKVFFYLLDVVLLLYLCLWNGWSVNKLLGLVVIFQNRNFRPHGS